MGFESRFWIVVLEKKGCGKYGIDVREPQVLVDQRVTSDIGFASVVYGNF